MNPISDNVGALLKAASFAAERHQNQRRKGADAHPYINHPIEVAEILANVGGVKDLTILVSALLHDTIEDTGTTPIEIEQLFGHAVRLLVEEVTDDKRLFNRERKRLQIEHAPFLSPAAKQLRIADKISNLRDLVRNPPANWSPKQRTDYVAWGERVIAGCRGVNERLDKEFDAAVQAARQHMG